MIIDFVYRAAFVSLFLFAVYDMLQSFRASWVSGFKFYLGSIVLQDLPMGVIALRVITIETFDSVLNVLPILLLSFTDNWLIKQQEKAQQTNPTQWQIWKDRVQQAKRLEKVFLFRAIRRRVPATPQQEAASLKLFKVMTIVLVVVALLGIVLLGMILLSRGG